MLCAVRNGRLHPGTADLRQTESDLCLPSSRDNSISDVPWDVAPIARALDLPSDSVRTVLFNRWTELVKNY
jgi:hypothetical protein